MKKMNQKLLAGVLAISAVAASVFAPVAQAEVSASVGAANMYYWRGMDLGAGAAVWGDLKYSHDSGAYAGLWTSSGDALNGTEYDIYFGYGTEFGGVGIDISYWGYNYPAMEVAPGDFAEVVLGLSYGPVAFTYYDNIAADVIGSEDYSYYTLAYTHEAWSFKYGAHEDSAYPNSPDGYTHFDIGYAFNDNLSFTMGNVLDAGDNSGLLEEFTFVVAVTLPIE